MYASLSFQFPYSRLRKMHFLLRARGGGGVSGRLAAGRISRAGQLGANGRWMKAAILLFGDSLLERVIISDRTRRGRHDQREDLNLFQFVEPRRPWDIIRNFYRLDLLTQSGDGYFSLLPCVVLQPLSWASASVLLRSAHRFFRGVERERREVRVRTCALRIGSDWHDLPPCRQAKSSFRAIGIFARRGQRGSCSSRSQFPGTLFSAS